MRSRATTLAAALLLVAHTSAAQDAPTEPAESEAPPAITLHTLEDAVRQGMAEGKVTVVVFGADWCGWCRKLETTTLHDAAVVSAGAAFVFASVDTDDRPEVAAAFEVSGVPALAFLNARGELLALEAGYRSPTAMLALLEAYKDQAQADGLARRRAVALIAAVGRLDDAEAGSASDTATHALLGLLADADPSGRAFATQRVTAAAERALPALVGALASPRLAVRAAAYDLLAAQAQDPPVFDPFADTEQRTPQADAWADWLAARGMQPAPPPESSDAEESAESPA